jgi:hypothetical protein
LSLPLTCKNSTASIKGQLNEKVSISPSKEGKKLIQKATLALFNSFEKVSLLKYTLSRGLPMLMHELSDFVYFGSVSQMAVLST